jgi:hypothetical protein
MRKRKLIILGGILTTVVCCYLVWYSREAVQSEHYKPPTEDSVLSMVKTEDRVSIAFILGEDKEKDNPYYEEARRYYTTNSEGKTDRVVSTCRSLLEVKDYLKANTPSNGLAWGTIHLVSHGNQWTGLSVKVTPDSKRATTQRILDYTQSIMFESFDETVVDSTTKIFLHGCGIGNNGDLVEAIRLFFGFKNGQPGIVAPKLFEYYASSGSEENLQSLRYLAESWLVSYPMGDKLKSNFLANELREKYAEAKVDWQDALSREQPRWIGDTYHYTFEVPVKWIIAVDSLPDLQDEVQQTKWLQTQQQIVDELEVLQIPIEKFKWSFSSGYVENNAGLKTSAVVVKGYCTMLCVLQALTEDYNPRVLLQKPFVADLTDTRFYYSAEALEEVFAAMN